PALAPRGGPGVLPPVPGGRAEGPVPPVQRPDERSRPNRTRPGTGRPCPQALPGARPGPPGGTAAGASPAPRQAEAALAGRRPPPPASGQRPFPPGGPRDRPYRADEPARTGGAARRVCGVVLPARRGAGRRVAETEPAGPAPQPERPRGRRVSGAGG